MDINCLSGHGQLIGCSERVCYGAHCISDKFKLVSFH